MKSLRRIFTAALALVLCLSSCKSQYEILLEGNDTEAKYAAAFDYFNQGKFTKASQLFESLSTFLHLDCLYRGTYRYELDQTPTYKTITAISEYLMTNPGTEYRNVCYQMLDNLNERLDRKAYENAYLYYKMEDYLAARVALRNVLKDDADNRYREDILYYTAMASYKYASLSVPSKQKERFLVFYDDYFNYIGEYPDTDRRKELEKLYTKAKEKY